MFSSSNSGRYPDLARNWRSPARETPLPPLGPLLTTIQHNELEADQASSSDAKITGLEDLASYNWLKADEPTIITPGKPPKWTPIVRPERLAEDDPNGIYYRDPNAAYFPSYPMEPVVRSIFEACPDFNTREVDVFACGSTLGNLLRFACNIESEMPFHFLVEVVGETIFLIRRENSPKEVIKDLRGFGHSFPEANTTWDTGLQRSDTHQRIIRYQLGHLNTIVRFEGDGYLGEEVSAETTHASPATREDFNEDSLVSALAGNTISTHTPKNSDNLQIIRGQGCVPLSAVFDVKTRSIKRKLNDATLSEQIPRLWVRQIPFFILAYHERGLFRSNNVMVHDVKPEIARWESENKENVCKLIALIEKIAKVVKTTPGRKLQVRYQQGLGLELREQVKEVASVLPKDLAAEWADRGNRVESTSIALESHSVDGALGLEHDSSEKGLALDEESDALDDGEYDWDKEKDYTACSMESCEYCGHCSYPKA
ncbi:MAG: hypothetical protein M1829_001483 [Trizodia sp. TS-e1964]|nr:MAG: hypothetical protein M1829_001483 [Trizodia sp. TS-e1964]